MFPEPSILWSNEGETLQGEWLSFLKKPLYGPWLKGFSEQPTRDSSGERLGVLIPFLCGKKDSLNLAILIVWKDL